MSEEIIGAAALTSRYVVGFVFLTAALPKLFARRQFAQAVSNYKLLPERLVAPVAAWLPRLELACGVALVLGIAVRPMATIAAALLVTFIVGVAVNLRRGREIECGCSGSVAPRRIGWGLVLGDLALAAMAAAVVVADPGVLTAIGSGSSSGSELVASDGVAALLLGGSLVLVYLLISAWRGVRVATRAAVFDAGTA